MKHLERLSAQSKYLNTEVPKGTTAVIGIPSAYNKIMLGNKRSYITGNQLVIEPLVRLV